MPLLLDTRVDSLTIVRLGQHIQIDIVETQKIIQAELSKSRHDASQKEASNTTKRWGGSWSCEMVRRLSKNEIGV